MIVKFSYYLQYYRIDFFIQPFSNQGVSRLSNDELKSRMIFFAKAGRKQWLFGGGGGRMCLCLALPLLSPSLAHIQQCVVEIKISLCVVLSVFSIHVQHCNAILFVHSILSVKISRFKRRFQQLNLKALLGQYASVSINQGGWQPSLYCVHK